MTRWTADDHERLADDRSVLDHLRELRPELHGDRALRGYTGLPFVADDGGRAAAGFRGSAGDCVTRALAIATGAGYRLVYDQLAAGMAAAPPRRRGARAGQRRPRSARAGVLSSVYRPWLAERGWLWTPTMGIGTGTTVHLRPGELPDVPRLIARCSRHLVAVIDGVAFDTADPCRGGTRAVYGYWTEGPAR